MLLLLKSFGVFLICFPFLPTHLVRVVSFWGSLGVFVFSLFLWFFFNSSLIFVPESSACVSWFGDYLLCFGVDAMALFFIILTTFIFFICVLASFQSVKKNLKQYLFLLFLIEFLLLGTFSVLDFFVFYVLFESVLLPMFLLIGFWGSNVRRMKAAYYLFLYTLLGSLFLLLSLLLIGAQVGTFNWYFLLTSDISVTRELFLWPGIFFAFAVKVPMFPFHVWLPEAHVEAPTGGSIILASLLLKLGVYGFLRFLVPLFPFGTLYYSSLVVIFALLGVFYSSFVALRQIDLKRIIAYSSVAHMNFGIVGLFSLTLDGLTGGYLLMLGHGLVSGALFFLVGVLYDRYKTRICFYYSGLALRMPLFATFLFFFSISNIAFPGTFNFVSELLVFMGAGVSNFVSFFLILVSLLGTTGFTFWLYNRLAFGTFRYFGSARTLVSSLNVYFYDLTRLEFGILVFFTILTLLGGLFPGLFLGYLDHGLFYYFV
jgi:proton-translocating NADH-quinone oxidoreductase chain M